VVVGANNMPLAAGTAEWRARVVYALLFLFPLFGASLDHWLSGIFTVIFLMSLACLFTRPHSPLFVEERWLLYLVAIYFATFLLSAFANGWTDIQTRYLGVEIRYLAAVPVYLMLRRFPDTVRWLLLGSLLAGVVLAAQAYCDVYVLNKIRAWGVYSPNLFGPFAALIAVWALVVWQANSKVLGKVAWLLPLVFLLALAAVILSGSRGAYVGMIAMLVVWVLISLRHWQRPGAILLLLLSVIGAYHSVDSIKERVDKAASEIETYLSIDYLEAYDGAVIGNVHRLEIWRTAILIFKDAPVVGIGRGNYEHVADEYVAKGLVHPMGAKAGHAHNAYLDVLASRGIIGFVVFMAMLLYPLYYFYSTRRLSPFSAMLGLTHIIGFMTFSMTDASTFIKGNFVSIFLLYLIAFFSWHVTKVREAQK